MTIDQHGGAEIAMKPHEQATQRTVVRLVKAVDPAQRLGHRDTLVVDFLGVADDTRHRAEAAGNPHRAGIGEGG